MAECAAGCWDAVLEDRVVQAALNLETQVVVYGQIPKDGLFEAVQGMLDRNPRIFWLSGSTTVHSAFGCRTLDLEPLYRLRDVPRMQGELEQALAAVVEDARRATTPVGQLERAYEWFCANVRYVPSALKFEDQTAYAALALRQAVCAGISRGFQLVMDELGIEGGIVVGDGDLRVRDRHAWNFVRLDGALYHIDVTSGVGLYGRTGVVGHPFFLQPHSVAASVRHMKTELDPGEEPAERCAWSEVVWCERKADLRRALYLDCSDLRTPSGRKAALTVQVAPGVFSTQEEFCKHLAKLTDGGSLRGTTFHRYVVHDGYILELM